MPTGFDAIDGLSLEPPTPDALAGWGISEPTPVQAESIGPILAGRNVVMHAGTGTGKTLAYVLPALQLLRREDARRVLIVAPGAELAMQTLRVAVACGGDGLKAAAAISTTSRSRERARLQRSTRLIVGTPDRLGALFTEGKLKGVGLLVLDELDPILATPSAAFLPELLRRADPPMQVVVASATLGERSERFIAEQLGDACARVRPAADPQVDAIRHHVVRVPPGQARDVALARFIEANRCRRAIVFASDPRHQRHLAAYLGEHRIPTAIVSRDGTKEQRQRGLEAFRAGAVRALLTTDAIARGLDLPEVAWVLHYDVPASGPAYVHRAGRTGRAGREGASVLFVESSDRGALRHLERDLGRSFTPFPT